MLKKLTGQGFHVNLWEHAFVNPASPVHDSLVPYSGDYLVWNGLVPDFSLDEASDIFAGYHKELCDEGITGFKHDECDGSDFTGRLVIPGLRRISFRNGRGTVSPPFRYALLPDDNEGSR